MTDDRKQRRIRQPELRKTFPRLPMSESWDEDVTPPPQEPPTLEGLAVHEQLRVLADGLSQVTTAIGKVWDERGNGERLGRVESAVAGYATQLARHQETFDGLIVPSVKSLLAAADSSGRAQVRTDAQLERTAELLEGISTTLKDVVTRIGRLENTVERLNHSDQALAAQVSALGTSVNAMDVRMRATENRIAEIERQRAEEKAVDTAVGAERVRFFTWGRAALVGGGGVAAWIATHLPALLGH